jgi:predicted metal-dependent phosphoesterase TrpH
MFGTKSVIRIDLHTHSEASPDGGITPEQYAKLLETETLDVIAITDHDRVDFALGMQKALGDEYIIVGEEITTIDGEIIGLYLSSKVEPGMSAEDTVDAIHAQNGLVYIPHPFEKVRKGLQAETLRNIMHNVDIIETINGRAFTKKHNAKSYTWATKHQVAASASSDAHGVKGVGKTYTVIQNRPTRSSLLFELQSATLAHSRPPLRSYFYPKINRLRQKFTGNN